MGRREYEVPQHIKKRQNVPTKLRGSETGFQEFETRLRARDTSAGSGVAPVSSAKGLSLVGSLSRGLYGVATGAEQLQVLFVVVANWQRDDLVYQDCWRDSACSGAMPA